MRTSGAVKLGPKEYRILLAQVVCNLRIRNEHGIDRYPQVIDEGQELLRQCGIVELRLAKGNAPKET